MKKISFAKLRRKYSDPTNAFTGTYRNKDYCVGGAICLELFPAITTSSFPDKELLAEAIGHINPSLDENIRMKKAGTIINYNDNSHYNRAWNTLKSCFPK